MSAHIDPSVYNIYRCFGINSAIEGTVPSVLKVVNFLVTTFSIGTGKLRHCTSRIHHRGLDAKYCIAVGVPHLINTKIMLPIGTVSSQRFL